MPEIVLTNVTKRWDKFYAVDDLNLVIDDNAFVTLLGPSGCGKTTTLRMIAGLETPTSGRITIGDRVVFDSKEGINVPANKRKVGFLFQNYALWPNMTVYENISFGLTNVKEEMEKVDFDSRINAKLVEILTKPEEVIKVIDECFDKNNKLDENKAILKLIDRFEISQFTAKKIMSYKLEGKDYKVIASKKVQELKDLLEKAEEKAKKEGFFYSKDYVYLKDDKPVMETRKLTKEEIDLIVRRVSRIVKIGMFMDRYPAELSGGQQQRVAIARTLAPEPTVLFMDEPLSNLDAKLRLEMRSELQRLHLETGSTFVYVTHDQMEAMTLATKICLIDNGILQQYDAPLDVYAKPNNLFVADFVGNPAINFIEAKGKQNDVGNIELEIFDGTKIEFIPKGKVDINQWYQKQDSIDKKKKEEETKKTNQKGYVEKVNKEVSFKYRIPLIDEQQDFDDVENVTKEDFVIGIRPEFVNISEEGKIDAEVYSSMPTGMETTVRAAVGNYLLTSVMFGGVVYSLEEKIKLDFKGNNAILFAKTNGRFVSLGAIKIK
ncbi:MAG TPA: ABC transporter ATP-binding protein [Erysipelotrichaceae bacterium]|nr:ABC transporter ATP-binding protein [Erysipelotrichia bacterium]HPX31995.1 ABC transporter ATP-binding protein [Erysipelotrichaceae bacterium]HQA84964.1 ABC transporter ATP-binding protein [Erysipelotrichaceae bacterium]